jgi:transcriptional regulator with XRE-family HTH domain
MTLHELVRGRKVKQREIAAALRVSEPTVSKWLSGQQAIPSRTIGPMAALLGVTPDEIVAALPAAPVVGLAAAPSAQDAA